MKQNINFKFLNTTNSGWSDIQKYFDMNQNERELLNSKFKPNLFPVNNSFFELLQKFLPGELNIFEDSIQKELSSDLLFKNQVLQEKNKRHQAYSALDYFLSSSTYFDYFSFDAFSILQNSKITMKKYKKNKLTSDIFLLSFFSIDSELKKILNEFEIDIESIEKYLITGEKKIYFDEFQNKYFNYINSFIKQQKTIFYEKKHLLSNFFNISKSTDFKIAEENNEKIEYSKEMYKIFEKSIDYTLRYKTPIITTEILFLSFIDEDQLIGGKIIRKLLKNPIKLSLLRYRILKLIHQHESNIRSSILKNQHFFAYLLKTELSDIEFQKLIQTNRLSKAVNMFRNQLISSVVELNLADILTEELKVSSRLNSKRTYSF